MISYDFWGRRHALDPAVLGQTLTLNGTGFAIVGVLPRGFAGAQPGQPAEFYVPMAPRSQFLYVAITSNFHWYVRLMAHLRPGADRRRAEGRAGGRFRSRRRRVHAKSPHNDRARARRPDIRPGSIQQAAAGDAWRSRACHAGRLRQYRRLVAGARRRRQTRTGGARSPRRRPLAPHSQSLTESLILSLLGGGLGILFAFWGRTAFVSLLAGSAGDLRYDFSLDATVLGFALVVALGTALASWNPARFAGSAGSIPWTG